MLATSIDWTDTVNTIARLAIPELADAGAVLVSQGDQLRPVAAIHHDPERTSMMRSMFEKYPPEARGPVGMGRIMLTGETLFLREVPDSFLMALSRSNEHLELLRKIQMKSYLGVPLVGHGKVLGVMVFATLFRQLNPANVPLLEELGRRCGAALENAQLYTEVQAAVRTREDFLAVASHELKTPLTPLNLLLTRLEQRVRAADPDAGALAQRARRSVDRLRALVEDLLDVAQLEAGTLELRKKPFSLREAVTQLVRDYSLISERHRLRLVASEEPQLMLGDRGRVEQVVANLLDNAIKYSPDGGEVVVRLESREGKALLSVTDSGIGIEPDQLPPLFDRFFRARSSPVVNYGGLGLGLYISKQIVDRHQGRIWVESAAGEGSTFFVEFPLLA